MPGPASAARRAAAALASPSGLSHRRGESHRRPAPTRESQDAVSVRTAIRAIDSNRSNQPLAGATCVAASASQYPPGVMVTTPSADDGQRKAAALLLLGIERHAEPSPSYQRTLISLPLLPRNT